MKGFSRRGEKCTDLERALAERTDAPAWMQSWIALVQRIGIDAVVAVMDEFGSERVHVPTRASFFASLWRESRDAEIVRRVVVNRELIALVAGDYGLTVRAVQLIRKRADDVSRPRVVDGAP